MCIGSKLICIVCVHPECTFGQSTSTGGLKANCIITGINAGVIYSHVINCIRKREIREEITIIMLMLCLGKVVYL